VHLPVKNRLIGKTAVIRRHLKTIEIIRTSRGKDNFMLTKYVLCPQAGNRTHVEGLSIGSVENRASDSTCRRPLAEPRVLWFTPCLQLSSKTFFESSKIFRRYTIFPNEVSIKPPELFRALLEATRTFPSATWRFGLRS